MTNENFYIISTSATIKSVPKKLDLAFKKELVTDNGDLKPHVEKIIPFVFSHGRQIIIATLPTLFIEITYKDSEKDVYLIDHEVLLYSEDMTTLKDLENYKSKFDFNFASQVDPEVYVLIDSFHMGYGCMCLSSEGY